MGSSKYIGQDLWSLLGLSAVAYSIDEIVYSVLEENEPLVHANSARCSCTKFIAQLFVSTWPKVQAFR